MNKLAPPSADNDYYLSHVRLLCESFQRLLQRPLLTPIEPAMLGQALYEADFALLSHDTASDPCFNYANRTALDLFAFRWDELIGLPSRFSAEAVNREERDRLLAEVTSQGFINHYSGVRIAKSGQRFWIENAVVWNVYDQQRRYYGQAACFKDWRLIDD